VRGWEPLAGGRSAETVRLLLEDHAGTATTAVLHVQPTDGPHGGIATARAQFELLTALQNTDVPVPRALWLSQADPPFLITEYVAGAVPNPWRHEGRAFLSAEQTARPNELAEDFVQVLATIHRVDPTSLPTSAQMDGDERSPARRELDRWTPGIRRSTRFRHDPVLTYAEEWLLANEPSTSEPALVHGDYRVGNLVINRGRIAAVLDWELARVGEPLLDVATVCSPPLRWRGLASGLCEPDGFVARYAEITGRSVEAVPYYKVLATFKIAGVWVNASEAFASGEDSLTSLRAGFSVLATRRMLAEELGLVTPPRSDVTPEVGRAFDTLRAALSVIHPEGSDPAARETAIAARSVLAALADLPPTSATVAFEREAETVFDALHFRPSISSTESVSLAERISRAVREVFAGLGPEAGTSESTAPLRRLVGRAATLPLEQWP
jgi:aminoglycoside phosphotransferase (APT) family kinase protein